MSGLRDCDPTIPGEHFVSASVLSHLGGQNVGLSGVPWLAGGATKDLPINAIKANILCKRHNEAFSQLDTIAGRFLEHLNLLSKT